MQQQRSRGFFVNVLETWYRLTSVPVPPPDAPLAKRELSRRTRVASITLLLMTICALVPVPLAILQASAPFFVTLLITLIAYTIALSLNRAGKINTAGIIVVVVLEAGFVLYQASLPVRSLANVPALSLLVEGVLVGIAFFSLRGVVAVTLTNIVLTLLLLLALPQAKDLSETLQIPAAKYDLLSTLIILECVVSAVLMLAMYSAQTAIRRADSAEKLAQLEHDANEQKQRQLETAKQIEDGIQQIIAAMATVVTQNDFSVRIPLNQENILWRVSKSINNLLSRLQGFKQSQEELRRTHVIAAEVAKRMRDGLPIQLNSWTGTALDPVIIEYNKQLQNSGGQLGKNRLVPDHTKP